MPIVHRCVPLPRLLPMVRVVYPGLHFCLRIQARRWRTQCGVFIFAIHQLFVAVRKAEEAITRLKYCKDNTA